MVGLLAALFCRLPRQGELLRMVSVRLPPSLAAAVTGYLLEGADGHPAA